MNAVAPGPVWTALQPSGRQTQEKVQHFGETAPLLFTALNNQFWSTNLNAPIASLPVVIFQFALSPYKDWQSLAWTGALIITLAVLALSITARSLVSSGRQP